MAVAAYKIDVDINEPGDAFTGEKKKELFYPKAFVKVNSSFGELTSMFGEGFSTFEGLTTSRSIVENLFHVTHYTEMKQICHSGQAVFNGKLKSWRSGTNPDKLSYEVNYSDDSRTLIHPDDDEVLPGKLLWFGTADKDGKIYGQCQFRFNYQRVLQAYQASRGKGCQICFKVGGTLVYQREVSHVVIVCVTTDKCYKSFPSIDIGDESNTQYFQCASVSGVPQISVHKYELQERHEHVIFAFHLPDNTQLILANEIGSSELKRIDHGSFCIKGKGPCIRDVSPARIDRYIEAKWNSFQQN